MPRTGPRTSHGRPGTTVPTGFGALHSPVRRAARHPLRTRCRRAHRAVRLVACRLLRRDRHAGGDHRCVVLHFARLSGEEHQADVRQDFAHDAPVQRHRAAARPGVSRVHGVNGVLLELLGASQLLWVRMKHKAERGAS